MTPVGKDAGCPKGAEVAVMVIVLLLVAVEHARAALGDAGLWHLLNIVEEMERQEIGLLRLPPGRATDPTGGGQLWSGLHWVTARAGLPWNGLPLLQGAMDGIGILGWWLVARRAFPPLLVATVALWLAVDPQMKIHLAENSSGLGMVAPILMAATLATLRGVPTPAWLTPLLFFWALHCSLGAGFLLPLLVVAEMQADRSLAGRLGRAASLGLATTLALAPLLWVEGGPSQLLPGLGEELAARDAGMPVSTVLASKATWLLHPVFVLGVLLVAFSARMRESLPLWRWSAAWLIVVVVPIAWLDRYDPGELYHFVAATPARALFSGAATLWLLNLILRLRHEARLGLLLAALALGLLLLRSALLATAVASPPEHFRGEPMGSRCPGLDTTVCSLRDVQRAMESLQEAGRSPERDELEIHGAYASCIEAAWRWERLRLGAPEAHAVALVYVPAGWRAGTDDLLAPFRSNTGEAVIRAQVEQLPQPAEPCGGWTLPAPHPARIIALDDIAEVAGLSVPGVPEAVWRRCQAEDRTPVTEALVDDGVLVLPALPGDSDLLVTVQPRGSDCVVGRAEVFGLEAAAPGPP